MKTEKKKIIYNYDRKTKEFFYQSFARANPKEKGKWLIPSCSTQIKPPKINNDEKAVFEKGKWVIKKDFRGTVYFNKKGDKTIIKNLGEEPPKGFLKERPIIFEEERLRLINLRKEFLRSTDWYIIRFIEIKEKPCPIEITNKRNLYRKEIDELKKVSNLEDLKKYKNL